MAISKPQSLKCKYKKNLFINEQTSLDLLYSNVDDIQWALSYSLEHEIYFEVLVNILNKNIVQKDSIYIYN